MNGPLLACRCIPSQTSIVPWPLRRCRKVLRGPVSHCVIIARAPSLPHTPVRHSREKPALDVFNRGRESRVVAFSFFLDAGSGSGMTEGGMPGQARHGGWGLPSLSRARCHSRRTINRHSRARGNPGSLLFPFFLDAGSGSGMTEGGMPGQARHGGWGLPSLSRALSFPTHHQSSFPRTRESRAVAFPFFLDAGSGSGMTTVACGFSGCQIGVRHDG